MLPKSWKYHISSFEELQDPAKFKAELRTTINNKEDALQWVQDFEAISGTNFRVTKTFKENSFRIVFKVQLFYLNLCCVYFINNFSTLFNIPYSF